MTNSPNFEPTLYAAHERLAEVQPAAYARSRNFLHGAVTRLSPYITHGLLTLPEVLRAVHARHPLEVGHKFVYELAWREYFQHVWRHDGERIFKSLHAGPLPDEAYTRELPPDIRQARSGVPVIDQAVRGLYATGWLHNHARMWLASYVVHVRRVHWRAGADWLYGHLLDGDLASNHLSWQWVAGTGSHKPYLFNADNVAKYAPPDWHSPGTVIDTSYDALDAIARGGELPAHAPTADGVDEPPLLAAPPAGFGFTLPNQAMLRDRPVRLIHPWSLGEQGPDDATLLATLSIDGRWPWSERRWRFVGQRMAALTQHGWYAGVGAVSGSDNPHLPTPLRGLPLSTPVRLFADPERRCGSFSKFWNQVTQRIGSVDELLGERR